MLYIIIHDYKYIFGLSSRSISQSTCSIKRDIGIFTNYRAKLAPNSRDVVASRKTSRDNGHNSMSLACASLINYSSCVIEAFAKPTAPSFVADDGGPYYAKPVPRIPCSRERSCTYIHIFVCIRAQTSRLHNCQEFDRTASFERWEGTAASVH